MGISFQMRGDHAKAAESLRQSVANRPNDASTLMNLGSSLYEIGAIDEALAILRRACELAPSMSSAWYNLGKALKAQLHTSEAREALHHALHADAGHLLALSSLADLEVSIGDIPAAVSHYRELLCRQPDHPGAWFALANLKTVPLSAEDVSKLQSAFNKPGLPADARIPLGFALAKALEDQAQYPSAFATLKQTNELKRSLVQWDSKAHRARIDAIMAAFEHPLPLPVDPTLGQELIFIASVPRSGSTLIEQMLASHPLVEGADEIVDLPQVLMTESHRRGRPFPQWVAEATADDWYRLGQDYLVRTARWRMHKPRSTDKNMFNWEHAGMIRAMLPGARIIRSHRDPVETCFACFRQLFSNQTYYSYDLNQMAAYYVEYARLTDFWLRQHPLHVLDLSYEALLAGPEEQLQRLLQFCGLPYDSHCLDFHLTQRTVRSTASAAQVRQSLRKDTSRSAHYLEQLAPLREQLAAGLAGTTLAL
ncbi:hypothetical protein GCM10027066_31810 [Dyella jejuensis]